MFMTDSQRWKHISELDPRITQLIDLAASFSTQNGSRSPTVDELYRDAKPFLAAIIGWRRGLEVAPKSMNAYELRFAEVIRAVPQPTTVEDEKVLSSGEAYRVAVTELWDTMIDAVKKAMPWNFPT